MRKTISILICAMILVGIASVGVSAKSFKTGDVIEFGTYPQSDVTDKALIAALNAAIKGWKSYHYYSGEATDDRNDHGYGTMKPNDTMQYTDVRYNGAQYRAVRFSAYRALSTCTPLEYEPEWTKQYDNGYYTNTVYWFKYDPIKWRVLDPKTGLLMSEYILDVQPFMNTIYQAQDGSYEVYGDPELTFLPSNYAKSSIRAWLNDTFLNTAFSKEQRGKIVSTTLDNKAALYVYSNEYDSAPTEDKVFLLSYRDIKNGDYGLNPAYDSYATYDPKLSTTGSSYAKCQGLEDRLPKRGSNWITRTALDSNWICSVDGFGLAGNDSAPFVSNWFGATENPTQSISGIRPAICLSSVYESNQTTQAPTTEPDTTVPSTESTTVTEYSTDAEAVSESAAEGSATNESNGDEPVVVIRLTSKTIMITAASIAAVLIVVIVLVIAKRKKGKS